MDELFENFLGKFPNEFLLNFHEEITLEGISGVISKGMLGEIRDLNHRKAEQIHLEKIMRFKMS